MIVMPMINDETSIFVSQMSAQCPFWEGALAA